MTTATRSSRPTRSHWSVMNASRETTVRAHLNDMGSTHILTPGTVLAAEKCRHKISSMPRWLSSHKVEVVRKLLAEVRATIP